MLIPVFDCSSLGTSMLKWLGSSHNLKFSGIQVTSPGGSLLILVTNFSRHKEPKIRVLESTEFRGWVSGNDSKWGCSFFHILVLKSCILSIGNIALYNNGYFWFRLDTMIIKCTTRSSGPWGGFLLSLSFRTTPELELLCNGNHFGLHSHIKLTKPWT